MDSESHEMIPCLDFSKDMLMGSEEWKEMSKKVREACETYGCFLLMCDKIPKDLYEDMSRGLKELFDLPEETKRKYTFPSNTFQNYSNESPEIPRQSFGIDVVRGDNAQAFTNLMWPQQNPAFCETLKSITTKMDELSFIILKMIQEGYDLPKEYASNIEELKSTNLLRIVKYIAPENGKENDNDSEVLGLKAHTDRSSFAILGQNHVQGLEVLTKENQWIQLNVPKHGFVVILGDVLKAWSNGKLHSVTHRVVTGDKDRYSFLLFVGPTNDTIIEVPHELVDDKVYPLRYRSFKYGDYYKAGYAGTTLDEFAGI